MPSILFVEDHEDTGFLIRLILADYGYQVTVAETLAEATRMAESGKFDLFLLDNRFPDGTGAELCKAIREFDATTPLVFFSGEHPAKLHGAVESGAQAFVLKPHFEELPGVITSLLRPNYTGSV
jgi:DNA-binding response OmpR family regulator